MEYSYNGVEFRVLVSAAAEELPTGYELEKSIEGKPLSELNDLACNISLEEEQERMFQIQREFGKLVGDACFALMQELAPATPSSEVRTLQDYLYPEIYTLQVLTKDDKLASHRLYDYAIPDRHPPLPETELKAIDLDKDIPTFNASQVVLEDLLQGYVWKVNVEGEVMICKTSFLHIGNSFRGELATYQKLRRAGDDLLVPKLKGTMTKTCTAPRPSHTIQSGT
jgi:hypothetical protein